MPYQGVIFDMDGVLADSEPAHFRAINAALAPYGRELSHEQHSAQMGFGLDESLRATLRDTGLDLPIAVLGEAYSAAVLDEVARDASPLPGDIELVLRLRELGIAVAVASSSMPSWIEATLAGIGLSGQFDAVVSGATVEHPKPAPDIYLRAAELLGLEASECIAIEDSPTGLRSAKASGAFTIQSRSSSTPFPPQPEADLVLESLLDFDTAMLG